MQKAVKRAGNLFSSTSISILESKSIYLVLKKELEGHKVSSQFLATCSLKPAILQYFSFSSLNFIGFGSQGSLLVKTTHFHVSSSSIEGYIIWKSDIITLNFNGIGIFSPDNKWSDFHWLVRTRVAWEHY